VQTLTIVRARVSYRVSCKGYISPFSYKIGDKDSYIKHKDLLLMIDNQDWVEYTQLVLL
jgi:hypothetical protein